MKKLHVLLFGLILSLSSFAQEKDPVILTIDGEDIYASEFLYIYSKNNDNPSFAKDSLDDYMELFINYKLKVHEAREQKYDTIPRLVNELLQYRKQLSLPYMTDKTKNEKLIEEAYERTKTEVRASHILVRLNSNPTPADTNAAYVKAMQIRSRILNGEDFADVAKSKDGSDDPSAKTNGGDLGYFTALQMVYPFEDAAFNLQPGELSMPVRTRFGYHIIKLTEKREAKGMIETAHILILSDPNKTSKEDQMKAEKKINEIYDLLQAGETFEDMALKYSEDQSSKAKGGLLPLFGSGAKQRMVPEFEEAAFSIAEDGQYSKPIKTMFGWHIIKRVQVIPIPTYDQLYRELKLRVERDMRAESTRNAFIEDLKKEYNYKANTEHLQVFKDSINNDIFLGKWRGLSDKSKHGETLFSYADKKVTVGDFEAYIVANQKKMRRTDMSGLVENHFQSMVRESITIYEDSQLERKYPDFRSLIKEYSDGILVFEIMQDEIWRKASKDTTGVKAYYEAHKGDFTYPQRYKGDLYKCKDKKTAKLVYKLIKSGKLSATEIEQAMNKDSELNVKLKSQVFNSETTEAFKLSHKEGSVYQGFKAGLNKPYQNGDEYYVFNVEESMAPRGREFSEAKGLVTAAYQNQLEKQWIEALRNKFEIKIHQDALYGLGSK